MMVIETTFDGYRFRSRTEARWAVFFRTCGINFEYEKEGYDLGGVWYLPDFWLSDLNRWFEVKGERPSAHEIDKCRKLALATECEVLLAIGTPHPECQQLIRIYPDIEFDGSSTKAQMKFRHPWRAASLHSDEREEGWQFADDCARDGTFWLNSDEFGAVCIGPRKDQGTDDLPKVARSVTARGFSAARSARFERRQSNGR
jgi:hypothetical protein